MNNKVLLYGKGNCIQYPEITIMEKNEKKNVYICIMESLCCPAAINTISGNNFILQFLKSFVLKKNTKEKKKEWSHLSSGITHPRLKLVLRTPPPVPSPSFAVLSVDFRHSHALCFWKQRPLKARLCFSHPSACDLTEKKTPFLS